MGGAGACVIVAKARWANVKGQSWKWVGPKYTETEGWGCWRREGPKGEERGVNESV